MKIFFLALLFFLLPSPVYCGPNEKGGDWDEYQISRAKVLEVRTRKESGTVNDAGGTKILTVQLLSGPLKGQALQVPYPVASHPGYNIRLRPADEVILTLKMNGNRIENAYFVEYGRDKKLFYLAALFFVLVVLMGGRRGIRSIVSLLLTGGAIFCLLLPLIFKGYDPIPTTVIVAAMVTAVTLVMIGGFSAKTLAAMIGTTGGVIVAGGLAFVVGTAACLTGFSDEEMQTLLFIPRQIDFDYRGILFAGMMIGALGAVMDVGMSIASAVEEIKKINPCLGAGALIRAGMNIGGDIVGTMSNTLILAYTGGAIPLLLVFMAYDTPLLRIINLDAVATEVVRALAGSVGIVLAIPITSFAAGILFAWRKPGNS